ncbi:unnamed protein product [Phyllotreta striolata]|uniref:Uncharacterized protein n=1 Tax=Phyllotreta striolata TaxID=444603 RepID=A0A9N9XR57_PHYSR|nr:unnamed protein product [Phyllotreta striolata]
MPVYHQPSYPPPYWVMPPVKPVIAPKQEHCAICELKELVEKIGQNVCIPNCAQCKQSSRSSRPASAASVMVQPPSSPCGDSPMVTQQQLQQMQQMQQIPPCPAGVQNQLDCIKPVPTYQWPAYTKGVTCPPQNPMADYFYHIRQHPYLPVKIDTLNKDPTKRDPKLQLQRAKSASQVLVKRGAEIRSGVMVGCECVKKNGLQDTCPRLICKDMPKVAPWEPCNVPCKKNPCKIPRNSIVEEDETEAPAKPEKVEPCCKEEQSKPEKPLKCEPIKDEPPKEEVVPCCACKTH